MARSAKGAGSATKNGSGWKKVAPRQKTGVKITLDLVKMLAQIQCTENEAAAVFGIARENFIMTWLKKPEFRAAWDQGRDIGKVELRRLQWRHAQRPDGSGVQMTIHLSKHWLGEKDKLVVELDPLTCTDAELAELIKKQEEALAKLQAGTAFGLDPQLSHDPSITRH